MSPEKLLRMANQIAAFMASKPVAEGVAGTAAHISDFWEPRMRVQLFALAEGPEAVALHPLVVKALPAIRRPVAA